MKRRKRRERNKERTNNYDTLENKLTIKTKTKESDNGSKVTKGRNKGEDIEYG